MTIHEYKRKKTLAIIQVHTGCNKKDSKSLLTEKAQVFALVQIFRLEFYPVSSGEHLKLEPHPLMYGLLWCHVGNSEHHVRVMLTVC